MSSDKQTDHGNSLSSIHFETNTLWGRLVLQSAFYRSLANQANATLGGSELAAVCGPPGSGRRTLVQACMRSQTNTGEPVRVEPDDDLRWLPPQAFSVYRSQSSRSASRGTVDWLMWDTTTKVCEADQRRLLHLLQDCHIRERGSRKLVLLHDVTDGRLSDRIIREFARAVSLNTINLPPVAENHEVIEIAVAFFWDTLTHKVEQYVLQNEAALSSYSRVYFSKRLQVLTLEHNLRDISTLTSAYLREVFLRLQTADRDIVPEDIITGLFSRFVTENVSFGPSVLARRIVAAYSSGLSLNEVLGPHTKVSWRGIQEDLQVWLGEQVQLVARARGCAEAELIDISQRQLQNWRRRTPSS